MNTRVTATLATRLSDPTLVRELGLVNGEWVDSATGSFEVHDPATGALLASLPKMGSIETTAAINGANAALDGWRGRTAGDRSQILRRWAALMRENESDLGAIITAEQGKPLGEARAEVIYAAAFVDWFAEEGRRVYGDVIPSASTEIRIVVMKQAIGVTAGITPWNMPATMVTRKAAPALAAGCTMVLKPAEQTPLTALALGETGLRAGLPPGVLNVVLGDKADAPVIGAELTSNPIVRKIGFTGSTEVGKLLMAQSSSTVKHVSLELGGNSPFIVFDDADLKVAVDSLMVAKYRNAGQFCTSANRILVQEGILDRFVDELMGRVGRISVGNGFDAGVDMGPLIDERAIDKIERHVADLADQGERFLIGGHSHGLGGTFYEPTVISGLTRDSEMWREETFGPVAGITAFGTEAEVIEMANDSTHGLVSYLYSTDIGRVWRVCEAIESGVVAVNTGGVSGEMAPFGGVKESGIGREGSKYGIDDWLEIKYLALGGIHG